MSKSNRNRKADRTVDEETTKIEQLLTESAEEFKRSFDKKPKPQVLEQIKSGVLK